MVQRSVDLLAEVYRLRLGVRVTARVRVPSSIVHFAFMHKTTDKYDRQTQ